MAENNGGAGNIEPSLTMLKSKELEIRQMFLHEATEHLNTITNILEITSSQLEKKQIDEVLRAAHSIKGGAAMMGFQTLNNLAHRFEEFLKTFKTQQQYPVSAELKVKLLAITDHMRQVITLNFEGAEADEQWLNCVVNPVFRGLQKFRGSTTTPEEPLVLPENEQDIVKIIFETEVQECLDHLESVLANSEQYNLLNELRIVLEALSGLGEMLQIPAFSQLCLSIAQELENTPSRVEEIARTAVSHLRRSQTSVLLGQINSLPFEIELADSSQQTSSTDFYTSSLQNEPEDPWANNKHVEQITEEEQLDFFTLSQLNLQLPLAKNNQTSEHSVWISNEQLNEIKEFIEITKSKLSQLDNLVKTIEQQRSLRGRDEQGAGTSWEQEEKSLLAPLPPAPCSPDENLDICSVPSKTTIHDAPRITNATADQNVWVCCNPASSDEVTIEFDDRIELSDRGVRFPSLSKKHTILVIDDSETIRELLKQLLLKAGYQVEMAENGKVAIEKLQSKLSVQRKIDVSAVICDIEMPHVTGYHFLARVKSDGAFKHLPVAMLTSKTEAQDRELAMTLGASAYFVKPCDQQKLLETLDKLICLSPAP